MKEIVISLIIVVMVSPFNTFIVIYARDIIGLKHWLWFSLIGGLHGILYLQTKEFLIKKGFI